MRLLINKMYHHHLKHIRIILTPSKHSSTLEGGFGKNIISRNVSDYKMAAINSRYNIFKLIPSWLLVVRSAIINECLRVSLHS